MAKHVVIIASGETERRALPHLVAWLNDEGISVDEVRIPTGRSAFHLEMAVKLVQAAWYRRPHDPPDKFVVLVDTDGQSPDEVLLPFRELPQRVGRAITASIQFAYAQWHLEAWYFADVRGLRTFLERDLGQVDASQPDAIRNPKLHLKNLLGERVYTAIVSEEIAMTLDGRMIAQCSPSFQGFVDALRNGSSDDDESVESV